MLALGRAGVLDIEAALRQGRTIEGQRLGRRVGDAEDQQPSVVALARRRDEARLGMDGEVDGYVFEELGECLLLRGEADEARSYFARAYAALSKDAWLETNEPDRLARLKQLGDGNAPDK